MPAIPGLEGLASGFGKIGGVMKYVLWGLVLGGVLYAAWVYTSYNVRVGIYEKSGSSGYITKWDKGKFYRSKKEDGGIIERFKMMKDKRWNQPMDKAYTGAFRKSMGRIGKVVYFAEDSEGRLQPVKPQFNLMNWKGLSNNAMQFAVTEGKKNIERFKKKNWLDDYQGIIQLGALALIFVMAIVLFRQISSASDAFGSAAASLSETGKIFASAASTCSAAPAAQVFQ